MSADAEEHTGNGTQAAGGAGARPDGSRADGPAGSDLNELGYEQARDELAEVVRTLEAGGLSLEESLALWERGESLANLCERHLAGARERVETALAVVTDEAEPEEAEPGNAQPENGQPGAQAGNA